MTVCNPPPKDANFLLFKHLHSLSSFFLAVMTKYCSSAVSDGRPQPIISVPLWGVPVVFIVGKKNTERDVKNEDGNPWCGQGSFSPYIPTSSICPTPKAGCLSFAEGVALHKWSLSLQDKEERIPGIRED